MLRKLKEKDTDLMLEWMHDKSINRWFQVEFDSFTKENVLSFIAGSFNEKNQHFAIVDEMDNYLGTISLKNISLINKNAEYAIVLRKECQGKGIAYSASKEILKYAFEELGLRKVYLNVIEDNNAAICLYKKLGFENEGLSKDHIFIQNQYKNLLWFSVFNN